MGKLEEKFLKREQIFKGRVLDVVRDTVRLPNERETTREFCLHIGAVAVLPLLSDGTVILEKQYRHAHGRVILEIPAGKLNFADEDRLEAAKRELREETGAVARKWTELGMLVPTPAIVNEKIWMFLAEDIEFAETELDDDEFIEVVKIPLDELCQMVMRGEIADAKTQICALKVQNLRKQ